ncbi:MAG: hypothetical protein QX197_08705 [Methylococcaceae bacterium]
MAFFGLQEAPLAGDNGFFGVRKIELRIKPAGGFVMNCVDEFYAATRKNIFLAKKAIKKYFNYFSMTKGGEQLPWLFPDLRVLIYKLS